MQLLTKKKTGTKLKVTAQRLLLDVTWVTPLQVSAKNFNDSPYDTPFEGPAAA